MAENEKTKNLKDVLGEFQKDDGPELSPGEKARKELVDKIERNFGGFANRLVETFADKLGEEALVGGLTTLKTSRQKLLKAANDLTHEQLLAGSTKPVAADADAELPAAKVERDAAPEEEVGPRGAEDPNAGDGF